MLLLIFVTPAGDKAIVVVASLGFSSAPGSLATVFGPFRFHQPPDLLGEFRSDVSRGGVLAGNALVGARVQDAILERCTSCSPLIAGSRDRVIPRSCCSPDLPRLRRPRLGSRRLNMQTVVVDRRRE